MKKIIRIWFSGFWPTFNIDNNDFINILREKYDVKLDSENPDYVFFQVNSDEHFKYENAIKISYTVENIIPDFNLCDYGIGFSYIDFEDRYLRFPLYLFDSFVCYSNDNYANDLELARKKHEFDKNNDLFKRNFCSFVYSNGVGNQYRNELFNELNKYKKVDSGGRYKNNIGLEGKGVDDKLEFQLKHKFSFACENTASTGYTTEKLVQSFAACTIPIYWGNSRIEEEFNGKAFVNCNNFKSIEEVIEYIKIIDSNEDLYYKMLSEPAFNPENKLSYKELRSFLFNIFDQDKEVAIRRNKLFWGKRYEKKQKIGGKCYNFLRKFIWVRRIMPFN